MTNFIAYQQTDNDVDVCVLLNCYLGSYLCVSLESHTCAFAVVRQKLSVHVCIAVSYLFPFLSQLLKKQTYLPQRDPGGDLLMAVDHCFSIRGQGTVMTGTILQGSLAINDTVEIPALKVRFKERT